MVINQHKAASLAFFTAGISFWLPSIVRHAIRGEAFSAADVALLSVACPILAAIAFFALHAIAWTCSLRRRAGMFLLGVWFWGPPCTLLSGSWTGTPLESLASLAILWLLFPLTTLMLAAYDGTLLALIVTSLGMVSLYVVASARDVMSP
jgi:hypothetical protein